jgi:DNA-directed RNA polymerase subunit beta'
VCVQCYGYDLSRGAFVDVGATVGVIAAQSIGEPGTQLTMRTFHFGGTATGLGEKPYYQAKQDGVIRWEDIRVVKNRDGNMVVMSRKARIIIQSPDGRELQSHDVEYGSILYAANGDFVTKGTKVVEWDPNNRVILTEKAGTVQFQGIIDHITVQEIFDEATNKSNTVVLATRDEKYQPAISIIDEDQEEIANYFLPAGSYLSIKDGSRIEIGDTLVKMPREVSKSKDITTGGLPRIAELFEARSPKNPAIITDIDGEVVIGGLHRGMRKVSVVSAGETFDYFVPRGKQLNVINGEFVKAGDQLTMGIPVLHDMLRIMGPDVVQRYLVTQIQEVYCLQGVMSINDKHIEVIVRQMMRKVRVVDPGDSDFLIGDRIDRIQFAAVNQALRGQGKRPAQAKPIIMGLTQASLGTESFISAASFQETTRILAEAATAGQVDHLYGLKENVIVGKLVPAGTGIKSFRDKYLGDDLSDFERKARIEEQRITEA